MNLSTLAEKLDHPLLEVRNRTVRSIDFKLQNGLVSGSHIVQDRSIMLKLLGCLQLDNSEALDAALLVLLRRVAGSPSGARRLLELGLEPILHHLQATKVPQLQPLLTSLLDAILFTPTEAPTGRPPPSPSCTQPAPLSPTSAPWPSSAPNHPQPAHNSHQQPHHPASKAATSVPTTRRTLHTPPHTAAVNPQPHTAPSPHPALEPPVMLDPFWNPSAALNASPAADATPHTGAPTHAVHSSSQTHLGAITSHPASQQATSRPLAALPADERTARVQARVAWRAAERQGGGPAAGREGGSSHLLLPWYSLGAADEQLLFEINVRLQYSADAISVQAALQDLAWGPALDVPPEAILQYPQLLDTLKAVLSAAAADSPVTAAAAKVLLMLSARLHQSIQQATSALLLPGPHTQGPPADAVTAQGALFPGPGEVPASRAPHASPAADNSRKSYPQPLPTASLLPSSRHAATFKAKAIDSDPLDGVAVDVGKVAHSLLATVLQQLAHLGKHFALLPVVQQLLPLAVPAGRDTSPQAADAIQQLLQASASSLASNLAIARAEMAHQGHHASPAASANAALQPLPFTLPCATILALACRLLGRAGRTAGEESLPVPPALLDTLAAAAMDESICLSLPNFQQAAQPLLQHHRPACLHLLQQADLAQAAFASASTLHSMVQQGLHDQQVPAQQLLAAVEDSLAALHYTDPEDDRLLRAMIQALSIVCLPAEAGVGSTALTLAAAVRVLLRLLRNEKGHVADAAYSLLEEALCQGPMYVQGPGSMALQGMGAGSASGNGASGVEPSSVLGAIVADGEVVEVLVMEALRPEGRHRGQAAGILQWILSGGGVAGSAALLRWEAWLGPRTEDPVLGALATTLSWLALQPDGLAGQAAGEGSSWEELASSCRRLFCRATTKRQAAAKQLLVCLAGAAEETSELLAAVDGDPFSGLLDSGKREDLGTPPSASALRNFSAQDVDNLTAVLRNPQLAPELRRSAALQLGHLSACPRLQQELAAEHVLAAVLDAANPSMDDGQAITARASGEGAFWSILDAQLPAASLSLLAALAARIPTARTWLLADGAQRLQPLLLQVFHPLAAVRRAVARLLAATCFIPAAGCWQQYAPAAAEALQKDPAAAMALPGPLVDSYVFPVRVAAISLGRGSGTNGPHSQPGGLSDAELEWVRATVEIRRLSREAGGPRALLTLLLEGTGRTSLPPARLHALVANLASLSLSHQAALAITNLARSTTHAVCLAAARQLQQLACMQEGALAVTAQEQCTEALGKLLASPPATDADREVWLQLLPVVQTLAASQGFSQQQLVFLALRLSASGAALLQSRPRPSPQPLVLNLGTAEQASPADVMEALLSTYTTICRHARTHCSAPAALQLLEALSAPALLQAVAQHHIGDDDAPAALRISAAALATEVVATLRLACPFISQEDPPTEPYEDALLTLTDRLVAKVAIPQCSNRVVGHRGRRLLKLALATLSDISAVLPPSAWSLPWQQVGGTFWLSKLTRDRDATLRTASCQLLAALLTPGADPTRHMVASGWPDAALRMVKAALDHEECYATRAAALRCLATTLTLQLPASQQDPAGAANKAVELGRLGREGLLGAQWLWQSVPALLADTAAPAAFTSALLTFLLQAATLDPSIAETAFATEESVQKLLDVLDPHHLLALATPQPPHSSASAPHTSTTPTVDCPPTAPPPSLSFSSTDTKPQPAAPDHHSLTQHTLTTLTSSALLATTILRSPPAACPTLHAALTSALPTLLTNLLSAFILVSAPLSNPPPTPMSHHPTHATRIRTLQALSTCTTHLLRTYLSPPTPPPPRSPSPSSSTPSTTTPSYPCIQWPALLHESEDASSGSLIVALVKVLTSESVGDRCRTAAAGLLGCLLMEASTANCLLHERAGGPERRVEGGLAAGSALGAALVALVPPDALLPVHKGPAPTALQKLRSSCIINALRNLLAHSEAAKRAALQVGLHDTLLECCTAAAVLAPSKKPDRPSIRAKLQRLKRPRGVVQTTQPPTSTANPTTPKRKPLNPYDLRHSASATAPPASDQPPSAPGPPSEPQASRSHNPTHDSTTSPSDPSPPELNPAAVPHDDSAPPPDQQQQANGHAPAPAPAPIHCAAPGTGLPSKLPDTSRLVAVEKVLVCLSLLKNLAYDSPSTQLELVKAGAVEAVQKLWPMAATCEPLAQELLQGALANLCSACPAAREALCTSPLLPSLQHIVVQAAPELWLWQLAAGTLACLAAFEDSASFLLRNSFLPAAVPLLDELLDRKDAARLPGLLQILTNLAAHPEPQRALLRSPQDPAPIALAASALTSPHQPVITAALALLRNLAFSPDCPTAYTAGPARLDALLPFAVQAARPVEQRALAASALWALVYQGEKVKAALRKLPACEQQLQMAASVCELTLQRLAQQHQVVGLAKADAVEHEEDLLEEAHKGLSMVLEQMHLQQAAAVQA